MAVKWEIIQNIILTFHRHIMQCLWNLISILLITVYVVKINFIFKWQNYNIHLKIVFSEDLKHLKEKK